MASKAQMQMLLNMGQQGPKKKKQPATKKNSLAGAAKRKLAAMNAGKKGSGSNNGIGHPVDTAAIDKKEAQLRAQNNGTN